ncbi:hypothetical protein ABI59_11965 [Acidobacteria bacterium Mor1]|nr:hypothetical protein ABI59_11965 [Acidobacteria bacterium Mor1]
MGTPFEFDEPGRLGQGRRGRGAGGAPGEAEAPASGRSDLEQRLTSLLERLTGARIDPERLEKLLDRIDSLGEATVLPGEPPAIDPANPKEIRKALIDFGRDISGGIRDLGRELVESLAGDDPKLQRNLEFALKRIGDSFRSDLRRAFRASKEGKSVDGEALLDRVQTAFSDLQQKLQLVFDKAQNDPGNFRGILGRIRSGDFGPDEARTGNVVPLDPTAGGNDGLGSLSLIGNLPGGAADPGPSLDLSSLQARFDQLLNELADRFAPEEPAVPAPVIPVYDEIEVAAEDDGNRLNFNG